MDSLRLNAQPWLEPAMTRPNNLLGLASSAQLVVDMFTQVFIERCKTYSTRAQVTFNLYFVGVLLV